MKAINARATRGLNIGSYVIASDNSGARIVKITSVKHGKTKKGRQQFAKLSDWVKVSVRQGKPDMKGVVFDAVIIRQKKTYRRYCISCLKKSKQFMRVLEKILQRSIMKGTSEMFRKNTNCLMNSCFLQETYPQEKTC